MIRLCFVAGNAAPAIFPASGRGVGGAETGAWTVARRFNQLPGCQAVFCVRPDHPLPAPQQAGVELHCQVDRFRPVRRYVSDCLDFQGRLPTLRRWKAGLLWRVPWLAITRPFRPRDLEPCVVDPWLAGVDCDAFITFNVSRETSRVVATAGSLGRPVILSLQSNSDVPGEPGSPVAPLARFVLERATHIVAQTRFQVDQVRQFCQRTAIRMPNPLDLAEWSPPVAAERDYVLWIGRADDFHKRPLRCLEVARGLPDLPFLMIMNPWDESIARQVRETRPANVTLREYVPYTEMPGVFARAKAYFSTGNPAYEGFPNVFLQAAASGTPIVTQFDFDEFVTASGAGLVVGESIPAAVAALARLTAGSAAVSPTVREYLSAHHDLTAYCRRLQQLIPDV